MKVTFLPSDPSDWLRPVEKPRRSAGVHVSKILTAMLKQAAPRKFGHYGNDAPGREATWEMGYLWEEAFQRIVSDRTLDAPGYTLSAKFEWTLDGIVGTPDRALFNPETRHTIVEETKASWISMFGLESDPQAILHSDKVAYWVLQVKTYCAMAQALDLRGWAGLDERPVPSGQIRAFFVNSDYRDKAKGLMAKPLGWRIEYERDELAAWWGRIVAYAAEHKEKLYEPGDAPAGSDDDTEPGPRDPGISL